MTAVLWVDKCFSPSSYCGSNFHPPRLPHKTQREPKAASLLQTRGGLSSTRHPGQIFNSGSSSLLSQGRTHAHTHTRSWGGKPPVHAHPPGHGSPAGQPPCLPAAGPVLTAALCPPPAGPFCSLIRVWDSGRGRAVHRGGCSDPQPWYGGRSAAQPSRAEPSRGGKRRGAGGQGRAGQGTARPGPARALRPSPRPAAARPAERRGPAPPPPGAANGQRRWGRAAAAAPPPDPTRPGPALAGEGRGSVTQPSPPSGPGAAQRFAVHFGETLQGAGGPWRVCEQWGRREGAARPRPQRVHQSSTVQQSTAINNKIPCRFFWQPKSKEGKGVAVGRRCRATRSTTGPIRHGATLGSR